jgi:hypothetical protein
MMSEYSIDQENSKMDSFYTINDSELDNQTQDKKSHGIEYQENRLRSKIKKYTRLVGKAHSEFESGKLFEDNMFPAINASLFENTQEMKSVIEEVKHISWTRPENIHSDAIFLDFKSRKYNGGLMVDLIENKEITMGLLSSQNFCNALAVVPSSLIMSLVIDCKNMHKGYVSFNFFKNGEWRYVIIDTLIPYSYQKKQPLYTYNANNRIFFISLLEKAYAKLNGGYDKIGSIPVEDIIVDLTNGIFTKIDFTLEQESMVH